jgi:hypothetical protein
LEGQLVNKSGNKQADMPIKKKKKKSLNSNWMNKITSVDVSLILLGLRNY